jgi:hypothetical protein
LSIDEIPGPLGFFSNLFSLHPSQVLTIAIPETPNEFFRFVLVSICSTRRSGQRLLIEDRQFTIARFLSDT